MLDLVAAAPSDRLKRFGRAVAEALTVRELTQRELAAKLSVSQPAVSDWINADSEPAPEMVFAAEKALGQPPGTLSRHLGYLPPAAVKHVATVKDAILSDSSLSADEKQMLLGAYAAAVAGKATRRGRPSKRA